APATPNASDAARRPGATQLGAIPATKPGTSTVKRSVFRMAATLVFMRVSLSSRALRFPVLVELCQEAVKGAALHIVRRRQPQLRRLSSADADLMLLPQPVLQIHAAQRRHIHRHDRTAEHRVRGSPRFGAALRHLAQQIICLPPVPSLDAID